MKYAQRRKRNISPVSSKVEIKAPFSKRTKLAKLMVQKRINSKTLYDYMQERSPRTCCTYQYLRNVINGKSSDFKISVAVMISDILEVSLDEVIDKNQIKTN